MAHNDQATTDNGEAKGTPSRRALLAGAAGALGVLAAESIATPIAAQAADNDNVMLGTTNTETHRTVIQKTAQDGYAAVQANATGSDAGLAGVSPSGPGVNATGSPGVHGVTTDSLSSGVVGGNQGSGYGVSGTTDSEGAAGVWGDNPSGAGVKGTSGYIGLLGRVTGTGGYGVWGVTENAGSSAIYADAGGSNGTALYVNGPAAFTLSGVVNIGSGAKSATVTGVSLRSGSLVLATMQNNPGVWVVSAVPNASKSKVTINLNDVVPAAKSAKVAWFVVN